MPFRTETKYNFGDGMYRVVNRRDPKFPRNAVWDALNCIYNQDSDNPEHFGGASRLGSTAMGGQVTGLYDYNNGDKLVAVATDGKVYEYGADWAAASGARATGNSTTTTTRWGGTMFYGASTAKNLLILANDDDSDDPIKYDTSNGAVAMSGSGLPLNGKYPVVWQGRLWLFDVSTAYASAPDDAEDFSTASGGFNANIFRGHDGNITGAAAFAQNIFIFKRSSIYRISPFATTSNIVVKNVHESIGCVAHNTIVRTNHGLSFMSEHGIETLVSTDRHDGFSVVNTSRNVRPVFDTRNKGNMAQAWALFNTERLEYYGFYPTGTSATPTTGLIGNTARERKGPRWTRTDRSGYTAGVVYNDSNTNYFQYIGDTSGNVYRMLLTTQDDWEGVPVTARIITGTDTQGHPSVMKQFGWSWVDVDRNGTGSVQVRQGILRRGLTAGTANLHHFSRGSASGWGVGEWGVAEWGGSGNSGERVRPRTVARGTGIRHLIESENWYRLNGTEVSYAYGSDSPIA